MTNVCRCLVPALDCPSGERTARVELIALFVLRGARRILALEAR